MPLSALAACQLSRYRLLSNEVPTLLLRHQKIHPAPAKPSIGFYECSLIKHQPRCLSRVSKEEVSYGNIACKEQSYNSDTSSSHMGMGQAQSFLRTPSSLSAAGPLMNPTRLSNTSHTQTATQAARFCAAQQSSSLWLPNQHRRRTNRFHFLCSHNSSMLRQLHPTAFPVCPLPSLTLCLRQQTRSRRLTNATSDTPTCS